ncbi:unnamed protein product [Trifolium pratense]|uniref:Uncharacterized protein n=1 Tax=Trifolium pratense TaxID=57577 RepID=A0ACB0M227_TRIPR|nr:unnamed protein product [Trifolium pratense]
MSMLDLNVDIIHVDDYSTNVQKGLQLQTFPHEISDSRTSNSSVSNPTDEYSSNNSFPFNFDLLKKENDVSETITRTLFPVSADGGGRLCDSNSINQRLNFDDQNGHRTLQQKQPRKSRRGPRSRSSQFRGVTFYRRTGRWESHIWDCGKQVYLGGFDTAHAAARAYDRAAVMFRGVDADINFILSDYEEDLKQMRGLSKEEFIQRLRRQTNGNSRRSSTYRSILPLHKYGQEDPPYVAKTFCHKSHMKETSFKASTTYKGEIIANSNKLHHLDLSLRISPSSKQLDNNNSGVGFSSACTTYMIPQERGTMEMALLNIKKEVPLQQVLAWQFCSNGRRIALGSLQSNAAASSGFVSTLSPINSHTISSLSQPQYYR